ncbi:hypothetical protein ScPMuIL_002581 [Solemya velum]
MRIGQFATLLRLTGWKFSPSNSKSKITNSGLFDWGQIEMKLTNKLCAQHIGFQIKRIWKTKATYKDFPIRVPRVLSEKNIEVINPLEKPPLPRWEPPRQTVHINQLPPEQHPAYNEEPAYICWHKSRFIEGLKQACVLSKCQTFQGFPPAVEKLIGKIDIPEQDMLVQRYIMQSQKWDPTKEKLPKRIDTSYIMWKFQREYGIPRSKSMCILINNLVRLCQMIVCRYPSAIQDRRQIFKPYLGTHYYFKDKLILINGVNEILQLSNKPLAPFADEETVDSSVTTAIPDIYPIFPTIDLTESHIYRLQNNTGFLQEPKHRYPHTLFMANKDFWPESVRQSRAIMYCLGYAVSQAMARFGPDVQKLPEPISVQCVNISETTLNFVFFQLNTMNFKTDDGVKNIAWLDEGNKLYDKLLSKPWLEDRKVTRYENYDPEPFKKLLALFLNGLPEAKEL